MRLSQTFSSLKALLKKILKRIFFDFKLKLNDLIVENNHKPREGADNFF